MLLLMFFVVDDNVDAYEKNGEEDVNVVVVANVVAGVVAAVGADDVFDADVAAVVVDALAPAPAFAFANNVDGVVSAAVAHVLVDAHAASALVAVFYVVVVYFVVASATIAVDVAAVVGDVGGGDASAFVFCC